MPPARRTARMRAVDNKLAVAADTADPAAQVNLLFDAWRAGVENLAAGPAAAARRRMIELLTEEAGRL